MESLYPLNSSMANEIARLFSVSPNVTTSSASSGSEQDNFDDFSRNGVDSEYCPELSWPCSLPPSTTSRTIRAICSSPTQPLSPIWSSSSSAVKGIPVCLPPLGQYTPPTRVMKAQARARKGGIKKSALPSECVFCRNNGEEEPYYRSHVLKNQLGLVTCPILKNYTCPICKSTGEFAHTIKYCPFNREGDMIGSMLKTSRTSTGRRKKSV